MKTSDPAKPKLVVIVGPTAVGKTELSIQLARHFHGEIISADSRLFYRGMDIGTAKPSLAEMAGIPHHLIDVADPDQTWSLSLFQQQATQIALEITARGKLPFLVGGTGQYIRAVADGWTPPEVTPNPRLRDELEVIANQRGSEWLYDRLASIDPAAAANIDHRNVRRTIRALEVIFTTGHLFSTQRATSTSPFETLFIGLIRPRQQLYARVDARIEKMFADGLLAEVAALLAKGFSPDLPSMSAIGYREAVAVLQGKMTQAEAIIEMKRITRVFVRRQANWFKPDDPRIHWFEMQTQDTTPLFTLITEFLT